MKILLAILLLVVISTQNVHAAQEFSVSPSIIELSGQSSRIITLSNRSEAVQTYLVRFRALISDTNGVLTPSDARSTPGTMELSGTDVDNQVVMEPNSSRTLVLSYTPAQARENSILGVEFISIAGESPTDRTGSNIEATLIVPILISYPDATSDISINDFDLPFAISDNKALFSISALNNGENPAKVNGTVIIRNVLYQSVASINLAPTYILSNQRRELLSETGSSVVWDPTLLIGLYQAELALEYDNKKVVKRTFFVGTPVKPTIILVIITTIAAGIYLRVRKYR